MNNWRSLLKADPIDWLLGEDNPSVRYYTLTGILDCPEDSLEVRKARSEIMVNGAVPRILAKQAGGGYWGKPEDFYLRSKYKGTVWQLIVLAELGADGEDEWVRKACQFILNRAQDQISGGFSYKAVRGGGDPDGVLPCLTGNMVWSLIHLGNLADPRVWRGIDWITTYQRFDDGNGEAPEGWPYDISEKCWGRHTCLMGVVKALKALSEIPVDRRSGQVKRTIERGAEYLLLHQIYKKSHDPSQVSKPEWLHFGFPRMWNTDALEILGILARLGYKDRRIQAALQLVVSKQDAQGCWPMEDSYNGRMLVDIERQGLPSKWVTLKALLALKAYDTP